MRNAEEEALRANIASLGDQLEELEEAEDREPGLEVVDLDPVAILVKLEAGEEPLEPEELEALEAFTTGAGDLIEDLVDRVKAGEELSPDDLELLRLAIGGGGEELAAAEKVAAAIIERSLSGVNRQDAVPLLSGLHGLNRGAGLVRKRFDSWQEARADVSLGEDLAQLSGDSVRKALPETLERLGSRMGGGQEPDEEDLEDVLRCAVAKMAQGLPLTEEEMAEAMAANLKGQPFAPLGGLTTSAHKALVPFNRTRPVESLQETMREIGAMIGNEREAIVLNKVMRGSERHELVNKSLGVACGAIFGNRQ